jgi:hypothetical protein
VHGLPIPVEQVVGALAYGVGYSAVVLALASVVLSRRDFN